MTICLGDENTELALQCVEKIRHELLHVPNGDDIERDRVMALVIKAMLDDNALDTRDLETEAYDDGYAAGLEDGNPAS
jgi:hypothetical protein